MSTPSASGRLQLIEDLIIHLEAPVLIKEVWIHRETACLR